MTGAGDKMEAEDAFKHRSKCKLMTCNTVIKM